MTWITEKQLEREIKNKGHDFFGTFKHKHVISGVRKGEIPAVSK